MHRAQSEEKEDNCGLRRRRFNSEDVLSSDELTTSHYMFVCSSFSNTYSLQ